MLPDVHISVTLESLVTWGTQGSRFDLALKISQLWS